MSRKTNRDHAKRQQRPMQEDEAIAAQISALLTPAWAKQKKYCRQLGLRDRILTLPLMVAAVLTMLWRDVAGVRELTRMLAREGFLSLRSKSEVVRHKSEVVFSNNLIVKTFYF